MDPLTDRRWPAFLNEVTCPVFVSPAWLSVLRDTYGFEILALAAVSPEGTIEAGLPYAVIDDAIGRRLSCLPFSDYADPPASPNVPWLSLAEAVGEGGDEVSIRVRGSCLPGGGGSFTRTGTAVWHGLDVTADLREPRQVRAGRRNRLDVDATSDIADLRAFFDLHRDVRQHKYGMLAQPWSFFEHIHRHWFEPGNGFVISARQRHRMVAACVVLAWQRTLYYKFSASDLNFLDLRPNDVMVWELIEHARRVGAAFVDWGLSDADQPGLIRFKDRYSDRTDTIVSLRLPGKQPLSAEMRRLASDVSQVLADPRVPADLAERAGNLLYRYFA